MQQFFFTSLQFLKFYWFADTRYRIHSPFVYEFTQEVLEDDRKFYVFKQAEILRGNLLLNKNTIEVTDFGAGSHVDGVKKQRVISNIAKSALSPAFQCRWLFKIVQLYAPKNLIELGTSLGISTLYLNEAAPQNAKLFTLEGAEGISKLAQKVFEVYYTPNKIEGFERYDTKLLKPETQIQTITQGNKIKNINLVVGRFEETFIPTLNLMQEVDLAFLDGNHRYEATIDYFEKILPFTNVNSVLIFDDIYWSEEMKRAWENIKNHPSVTLTMDLFWCGLVFFRKENAEKQHFKIIKAGWKPFAIGFLR